MYVLCGLCGLCFFVCFVHLVYFGFLPACLPILPTMGYPKLGAHCCDVSLPHFSPGKGYHSHRCLAPHPLQGQDDLVVPALGLSWSSCLNARLMLSRSDRFVPAAAEAACSVAEGDAAEGEGEGAATAGVVAVVERRLSVVFAPHLDLGGGSCKYRVTEEGVAGV